MPAVRVGEWRVKMKWPYLGLAIGSICSELGWVYFLSFDILYGLRKQPLYLVGFNSSEQEQLP